jgi:hypothetical protein
MKIDVVPSGCAVKPDRGEKGCVSILCLARKKVKIYLTVAVSIQ